LKFVSGHKGMIPASGNSNVVWRTHDGTNSRL